MALKVSDHCPLGYLFIIIVIYVFSKTTKFSLKGEEVQKGLSINILYFFVIVELVRDHFESV